MWGKRAELVVHQWDPFNAEPPGAALAGELVTAVDLFYARNHGPIPDLDSAGWQLRVDGLVEVPLRLSLDELRAEFTEHEVAATLQCAGNRRDGFLPVRDIPGEIPWGSGAISTATWAGIRLGDVLTAAGPRPGAAHAAFTAPDVAQAAHPAQPYGCSIPLDKAAAPEVLLAWSMNGAPLTAAHGAPLRVVVPGYIGARSVKWVHTITVTAQPSDNWFQATAYRIPPPGAHPETAGAHPETAGAHPYTAGAHPETAGAQPDTAGAQPDTAGPGAGTALTDVAVNAAILSPDAGAVVPAGPCTVRGYALAGGGSGIAGVEVSAHPGSGWVQADLGVDRGPWVWRQWTAHIDVPPGPRTLTARAWDTTGSSMPEHPGPLWNPKGYANNSWARTPITAS